MLQIALDNGSPETSQDISDIRRPASIELVLYAVHRDMDRRKGLRRKVAGRPLPAR